MNSKQKKFGLAGAGILMLVLVVWLFVRTNHKLLSIVKPDVIPDIAAARPSILGNDGEVLGASTNAAQNPLRNLYVNPFR
jgi:hypothetical protein